MGFSSVVEHLLVCKSPQISQHCQLPIKTLNHTFKKLPPVSVVSILRYRKAVPCDNSLTTLTSQTHFCLCSEILCHVCTNQQH